MLERVDDQQFIALGDPAAFAEIRSDGQHLARHQCAHLHLPSWHHLAEQAHFRPRRADHRVHYVDGPDPFGRGFLGDLRARLQQQRQAKHEAISELQRLLGRYPSGEMVFDRKLPVITQRVPAGLPAELLKRRPSIQAAWIELLAADAALAVAHRQRFPTLRLSASVSDSDSALSQLLDEGPLGWSLLGGLTQPLFAGGQLAARERQARAELLQAEQRYLDHLFQALTEVENRLHEQYILEQRYQSFLQAEENALAAQRLAFDQYQRGLINYTSVLESQRRAFDAQSTVLQLRNQLLQNRIALQLALGGRALSD